MMDMQVFYAPRDGWLPLLADGWRLPWIVESMIGHHGHFSILLTREVGAPDGA